MFLKITIIAIIAFVATADGSKVWDGLTARWSVNASDGFYKLPRTLNDARKEGWIRITATKRPRGVVILGFFGDPSFALLYSILTRKVVGFLIALSVADIKKSRVPIDYDDKLGFTRRRLNRHDYHTLMAMFDDDGRKLWIEMDGKFKEIPTKYELVSSETPYYSKKCVRWMGHHFYQVNSTTSITDYFPWFLVSVGDDIVGMGIQVIGNVSSTAKRTWFEEGIDAAHIKSAITDISNEVYQGIDKYGLISLHVWLKKNPMRIECRDECTAEYRGIKNSSGCRAARKQRALGSGNIC